MRRVCLQQITSRLGQDDFDAALATWLEALGPAKCAAFICGGVASRLGQHDFDAALATWLEAPGPAKCATFICGTRTRTRTTHTHTHTHTTHFATRPTWWLAVEDSWRNRPLDLPLIVWWLMQSGPLNYNRLRFQALGHASRAVSPDWWTLIWTRKSLKPQP
jgi:hypothetical protein